ncbi:helix-turn-helix domain-containing protein [Streptomyces sp. NBC_00328]|uniref:helix-turn-helix domain-containing protein n=1 Tax=Streptomyces sp. NBC_00328 TaxID=2903646 RepID=UPI002E2DC962|nr:helix-turn-helix transcriptional regulator [Streptomyces sp. NBC_00328]
MRAALERRDLPDLTGQELRISELARAGYSNRQIAETLFLAVRTVEFHLSSVYRKLGVSGRRELHSALGAPPS